MDGALSPPGEGLRALSLTRVPQTWVLVGKGAVGPGDRDGEGRVDLRSVSEVTC